MSQPPLGIDDNKLRIILEAERLFRHYGYAKTTVADIAGACGMSSANVYRFFASKAEINEAICAHLIAGMEGHLMTIVQAGGSASERLTALIGYIAKHTVETLLHEKKVHEMVVVAMEQQWGVIERHLDRVQGFVMEIIADGIASGEFRPQDPERAARAVQSSLACLSHPVVVAQCRGNPNVATPGEMAQFVVSALKA